MEVLAGCSWSGGKNSKVSQEDPRYLIQNADAGPEGFRESATWLFPQVVPMHTPSSRVGESRVVPHPYQHCCLILRVLGDVQWHLILVLMCISLMTNEVEHLFRSLTAIWTCSFVEHLFKVFFY